MGGGRQGQEDEPKSEMLENESSPCRMTQLHFTLTDKGLYRMRGGLSFLQQHAKMGTQAHRLRCVCLSLWNEGLDDETPFLGCLHPQFTTVLLAFVFFPSDFFLLFLTFLLCCFTDAEPQDRLHPMKSFPSPQDSLRSPASCSGTGRQVKVTVSIGLRGFRPPSIRRTTSSHSVICGLKTLGVKH